MREIKFRAWDKELKKMLYEFDENYMPCIDYGYLVIGRGGAISDYYEVELMQYTGLKDKNGKYVYESDIVKGVWYGKTLDKEIFGVVDFEEGLFGLTNKIDGESYSINRVFVEVIGNIYENPELL